MSLVTKDRVRELTTVLGLNNATLLGAVTGYQSFAAVGNGNTCYYTIADNEGNWEVGKGTYSTSGPTLERTEIISSSNSGEKVNFPAGTKEIFLTYPAERSTYVDGTNIVSGVSANLSTEYGGTGLSSYSAGDFIYYGSGSSFTKLEIGSSGKILKSNGTSPEWSEASSVAVATFSGGTTGLTPSSATSGNVTLAGTLTAANGGTGYSSYVVGDLLYASGAAELSKLSDVATGNALISGGVGVAPSYGKIGLSTHVSGTLPIANGGTNSTAIPTSGSIAYGTGTSFAFNSSGVSGQVLRSNGLSAPTWTDLSTLGVATISFGSTGLTPSTATGGAVSVAGTLITSNGGTGLSSYAAGDTMYYASGTALTKLGIGAANTVYTSSGTAPQWSTSLNLSGSITVAGNSTFSSTGALTISKGTTAQQPVSPVTGMVRYNTTTNEFEGYSGSAPAWKSIGGSALNNDTSTTSNLYPVFAAAITGTAENLYTSNDRYLYKPSTGELQATTLNSNNGIFTNSNVINESQTIASTTNGGSFGPISIASGAVVSVESGAVWTVV